MSHTTGISITHHPHFRAVRTHSYEPYSSSSNFYNPSTLQSPLSNTNRSRSHSKMGTAMDILSLFGPFRKPIMALNIAKRVKRKRRERKARKMVVQEEQMYTGNGYGMEGVTRGATY